MEDDHLPQYEDFCHVPSKLLLQNDLIHELSTRWKQEDEEIVRVTREEIDILKTKKQLEIEKICAQYELDAKKVYENEILKQNQLTNTRRIQIEAMFKPQSWLSWFSFF